MKKKKIAKIITFPILTAATIQLINFNINRRATCNNLLSADPDSFFLWKNAKIYYTKKGSTGSPVILLHDLNPSASAAEWSRLENYLSKNHRVYSIDLLGCGRSDKPDMTYANIYYVQLLIDFIKSRICEKTFIVTSGYSASIALMADAYDSSKFSGMLFINPPALGMMSQIPTFKTKLAKKILELPIIGTLIYNMKYTKTNIEDTFTEKSFYNPFFADSKIIDTYYKSAHLGDSNGRYLTASLYSNYINIDLEHALKTSNMHSDIIVGSALSDSTYISKAWKHYKPDINIISIEHTKQYPHLEEPEYTSAVIEDSIVRARQKSNALYNS